MTVQILTIDGIMKIALHVSVLPADNLKSIVFIIQFPFTVSHSTFLVEC